MAQKRRKWRGSGRRGLRARGDVRQRKEGQEEAKLCHGSRQRAERCALPWANFGFNLSFRGCVKFGFFLGEATSCMGLSPGG